MAGEYAGLSPITGPMSRTTSRSGFVVASGKKHGGGRRKSGRFRGTRPRSSRWWQL